MEEHLLDFLLEAKRHTYAAKGAETTSSRPGSHDLRYASGELLYLDTYLGGSHFAGEEALWERGVPLWSMNYMGRVLDAAAFSGDFLKAALLRVPRDAPYRGPDCYRENGMVYTMAVSGEPGWFQGREQILLEERLIYECFFHGGCVR